MKKQIVFILISMILAYVLFSYVVWNWYWFENIPTYDYVKRALMLFGYLLVSTLFYSIVSLIEIGIKDISKEQ